MSRLPNQKTSKRQKSLIRQRRVRRRRKNRREKFNLSASFMGVKANLSFKQRQKLFQPRFSIKGNAGGNPTSICCSGTEAAGSLTTIAPVLAGTHLFKFPLRPETMVTRLKDFANLYEMFNFKSLGVSYKSHIAPVNSKNVGSIIMYYVPDPEEQEPLETKSSVEAQAQRSGSIIIPVKDSRSFTVDLSESVRSGITQWYVHAHADEEERFFMQGNIYVDAYSDLDAEEFGELFFAYECELHAPSVNRNGGLISSQRFQDTTTGYDDEWFEDRLLPRSTSYVKDDRIDVVGGPSGIQFRLPAGDFLVTLLIRDYLPGTAETTISGSIGDLVLENGLGDCLLTSTIGTAFVLENACQAPSSALTALSGSVYEMVITFGLKTTEKINMCILHQLIYPLDAVQIKNITIDITSCKFAESPSAVSIIDRIPKEVLYSLDEMKCNLRTKLIVGKYYLNKSQSHDRRLPSLVHRLITESRLGKGKRSLPTTRIPKMSLNEDIEELPSCINCTSCKTKIEENLKTIEPSPFSYRSFDIKSDLEMRKNNSSRKS